MRRVFVAAVSAACLSVSATPACAAEESVVIAPAAALTQANAYDRSIYRTVRELAPRLFSHLEMDAPYGRPAKGQLGDSRRLRLKSWSLVYRPFGGDFRLFAGARKEKLPKFGRSLTVDRGSNSGTAFSARRRFSPGIGAGYDLKLDGATRFSLEGSMSKVNRDANIAQLVRLASLGEGSRLLGAPKSRFGPAMRFTLTKAF
jgi:hypothetical protein